MKTIGNGPRDWKIGWKGRVIVKSGLVTTFLIATLPALAAPTGLITLRKGAIVLDPSEPLYVQRAVGDLQHQIRLAVGKELPVFKNLKEALATSHEPRIIVGKVVKAGMSDGEISPIPLENLGVEGFVLRVLRASPSNKTLIIAAGQDPHGTNYAVLELARQVSVSPVDGSIPDRVNELEIPDFGLRGMYAHQHWQYNYPYALRSWSLDDWKRYVDLLAYLRINLFQLWTMDGILPDPLSPNDKKYLAKYNEVIRYARDERGMKQVWPGECANNIATSDHGTPIERREYFVVEEDRKPGDPKH